MSDERQWLQAEQSGLGLDDELAETLFACLVAQMPAVEPSADFVARTVQAAWQARARRRLLKRLALGAAAVWIAVVAVGWFYGVKIPATLLVVRGTVLLSHGLVWLLTSAGEGAHWWWIAERIGTAVGDATSGPAAAAAMVAVEMIALLAMYALRRLLGDDLNGTK